MATRFEPADDRITAIGEHILAATKDETVGDVMLALTEVFYFLAQRVQGRGPAARSTMPVGDNVVKFELRRK